MGWRGGWRRAVVAAGCTSVVLGYLGLIAAADLMPRDPSATTVAVGVGLVVLIPLGFVLMFEGLVTWPADGSPYPWRRRVQGATAVLAAFGVVVLTTRVAGELLPHQGWVAVPVLGFASWMAGKVFGRLRPSHPAVTDPSGDT